MIGLLAGPLSQAIGLSLLHLLWQGALIAALLFVALRLLHDADARYTASCAALAGLLAFGVATAYRVYEPPLSVAPITIAAPTSFGNDPIVTPAGSHKPGLTDRFNALLLSTRHHAPQIVLMWMLGVLFLTVRLAVTWRRADALVRRLSSPASDEWHRVVARLSASLGVSRAIRVVESAAVEVPSVIGWLRPVILLPVSSLTGLTAEQLEMVLAHELAHVRRHDFLVNVLQSVIETLLFYHPAAWWISRQIRIERENCCDDLAVAVCGNPLQYARALTMLEQIRTTSSLAVAATGGSLLERVRRLVVSHTDRSSLITGWTAIAAAASFTLLLAITSVPAMAEREKKKDEPKKATAKVEVKESTPKAKAPSSDDDFDFPDVDIDFAHMPSAHVAPMAHPAMAPRPVITPTPGVPMDLAATMALAGDVDIDLNIDLDLDPGEQETTSQKVGADGKLSIDDLIALRISGVTPQYLDEMRRLFGDAMTLREISSLKMQGVGADYVAEMRAAFGSSLSSRDILGLRVQGVSAEYVRDMRAIFGASLTARDVTSLRTMGVGSKWLQEMRAAGVDVKNARDAISLRNAGVTASFVKSLADAGYPNLTVRDLRRLAESGINADFIREIAKYREKK